MEIKYSCTYWGSEKYSPAKFIERVAEAGYNGIEVFLQPGDALSEEFSHSLNDIRKSIPDFYLIALQLTFPGNSTVSEYIKQMQKSIQELATYNPLFINSHTGRDFYSFDDNCRIIEAANESAQKEKIRLMHETHRGRFSFHAAHLLPYLERFPELELVADFSHFCNVSESMLEDQNQIIDKIIPHVGHVHARIGFEEGPQVNDPSAPEWSKHLDTFMNWWKQIAAYKQANAKSTLTFTTEFGPIPYMPAHPRTLIPLSDQWESNLFMLNCLKKEFGTHSK